MIVRIHARAADDSPLLQYRAPGFANSQEVCFARALPLGWISPTSSARLEKKRFGACSRPPRSPVTNWLRESIKQLFSLVTATPRYEPIGRSRKPGCMFGKSGSVLLGSGARYFCVVFIRARNPGPDSCLVPQISDSGMWAGQLGVGACLQPRSPHYFDSFGRDHRKNYTGDPILK